MSQHFLSKHQPSPLSLSFEFVLLALFSVHCYVLFSNSGKNNVCQQFSKLYGNKMCYLRARISSKAMFFPPVFRHLLSRNHGVSRLGQKDNLGAEVPQQCHHNQRGGKILE